MKTWLITGCSSGFGRDLAEYVLQQGDAVAATARNPEPLQAWMQAYGDRVFVTALDVTDPEQIQRAVAQTTERFGRIDVLVNNAGYGLIGALEEYTEEQILRNIQTNFLGPLRLIRTVLPKMRHARSGTIVNMGAVAAFNNHPGFSVYGGAKAALGVASDALAQEVGPLGIKVINVDPGPFRTDFISRSLDRASRGTDDYTKTSGKFAAYLDKVDGQQPGDPRKAAAVIWQAVNSERPPSRLALGKFAYQAFRRKLSEIARDLDQWQAAGEATDF